MATGYSSNKDNKGLEDIRQAHMKEQAERARKQHLATDLNSKKSFLFSTKTTIDMKSAVMKTREMKMRALEGEIRALEIKEKTIDQKLRGEEMVKHRLDSEEEQKKNALNIATQSKRTVEAESQKIDRELTPLLAEEQKVTREIEAKKMQLANLQKEEDALKKKKAALGQQHGGDAFGKKIEITTLHANAERKAHDIDREKHEAMQIKQQKEQKERDLAAIGREHDELKREIDQLSKDKVKLEAEVRALESGMR